MLYKVSEWVDITGQVYIQCDDLVGTGRNWFEGSKVLGIDVADYISMLRNEYNANISAYRKDGKLSFVGFSWDSLADARKYKNYINKVSREKGYQI